MEDYEYFKLLDRLRRLRDRGEAALSDADSERLDQLLDVTANLPGDLLQYDRSGDRVEQYREAIGEFLNEHPLP